MRYALLAALLLCGCGGGDSSESNATVEITECALGDTVYTLDSSGNVIQTRPVEETSEENTYEDAERDGWVIIPQCGSDVTISIHEESDDDVVTTNASANLGYNEEAQ